MKRTSDERNQIPVNDDHQTFYKNKLYQDEENTQQNIKCSQCRDSDEISII